MHTLGTELCQAARLIDHHMRHIATGCPRCSKRVSPGFLLSSCECAKNNINYCLISFSSISVVNGNDNVSIKETYCATMLSSTAPRHRDVFLPMSFFGVTNSFCSNRSQEEFSVRIGTVVM